MHPDDRKEVARCLLVLAEIYRRELSDGAVEMYLHALRDLSLDELKVACDRALGHECKFFPTPVELREMVQDSATERAERAWVLLVEACHKSGDQSVFFEDNNLGQTMLDMFGTWIAAYELIVNLSPEMQAAKRKEFVTLYRMTEKRGSPADVRLQAGRHELNNRESHSLWKAAWLENGRTAYHQYLLLVRDRVITAVLTFDTETGRISAASWNQLNEGTEPKGLPTLVRKMIEGSKESTEQVMAPEEIREAIKELAGSRRM